MNTGVLGAAFSFTTACMGSGRLMKYGGSSLTSVICRMTRWLSVSGGKGIDEIDCRRQVL